MNSEGKTTKILGAAFLLQAVTSLISGAFLLEPLIAPEGIAATLSNVAHNPWQMRAALLGDVITAMGIVFLGAILFVTVRRQNEKLALTALGLYVLEAGLLAASRLAGFTLLPISQAYAAGGDAAGLQTLGSLALEAMTFGYTLHMLPFCAGALLFYYLLYRSDAIPRALSLWGLAATPIVLIAILFTAFGYEAPLFVYLPYAPFEFVVGIWILVRGVRKTDAPRLAPQL